jgi:hypothetical protein
VRVRKEGTETCEALRDLVDSLIAPYVKVAFDPEEGDLEEVESFTVEGPEGGDDWGVGFRRFVGLETIENVLAISADEGERERSEVEYGEELFETYAHGIQFGEVVGAKTERSSKVDEVVREEDGGPWATGARVGHGGSVCVTDDRTWRKGTESEVVRFGWGRRRSAIGGLEGEEDNSSRVDNSVMYPGRVFLKPGSKDGTAKLPDGEVEGDGGGDEIRGNIDEKGRLKAVGGDEGRGRRSWGGKGAEEGRSSRGDRGTLSVNVEERVLTTSTEMAGGDLVDGCVVLMTETSRRW